MAVLTVLLIQWTMGYIRHILGTVIVPGPYDFTITWCLALAVSHSFFSKLPYTGTGVAVSSALGYTIGIALFNVSTSLEVLVVSFMSFMLVEYYAGLMRVKRLKKNGYVEQVS